MAVTDITPPSRFADARRRFIKYGFGSPVAATFSVFVFTLLAYNAWRFLDWAVLRAV